jgi:deoxyadenosine/deoxycytidine kinase
MNLQEDYAQTYWTRLIQTEFGSQDWIDVSLEAARMMKLLNHSQDAIDFYINVLQLQQQYDVLEEACECTSSDEGLMKLFQLARYWEYSTESEWSRWKLWDKVSVVAFYQHHTDLAAVAYGHLINHFDNIPSSEQQRVLFNARFYPLSEEQRVEVLKLALEMKQKNMRDGNTNFHIYINGNEASPQLLKRIEIIAARASVTVWLYHSSALPQLKQFETVTNVQLVETTPIEDKPTVERVVSKVFKIPNFSFLSIPNKSRVVFVSIEGNIGSGKTSLLHELAAVSHKFWKKCVVLEEDIKGWTSFTDSNDQNLLQLYYTNPQKYSYCFQSLVLLSRLSQLVHHQDDQHEGDEGCLILSERCVLTDLNIFAKMLRDQQSMDEMEWLTYEHSSKLVQTILKSSLNIELGKYIYVQTDPEKCMHRINFRGRKGEENISSSLIQTLHDKHQDWLSAHKEDGVIHFDGNIEQSEEQYKQQLEDLINQLNAL